VDPSTIEQDKYVSGARTACGIGGLAIARYALDAPGVKPTAKPRPSTAMLDRAIFDGFAWLSKKWDPWANPGEPPCGRNLYYLYCVERAMDLTGAEKLGKHFWYLEMVKPLLKAQDPKAGSWDMKNPQIGDRNAVCDTAFALLFLRRATKGGVPMPVVTSSE